MPTYDYKCNDPKCNTKYEEYIRSISQVDKYVSACPICGGQGHRLINQNVRYQIASGAFFEPYVETDLGPEPVPIRSVDHLQEECRKRGLGCKKMPPKVIDRTR